MSLFRGGERELVLVVIRSGWRVELHTWLGGFAATIISCAAVLCTLFTVLRPWTLPLGEPRAAHACVSGTVIHHWCVRVWGQHRAPQHVNIFFCFRYQGAAALLASSLFHTVAEGLAAWMLTD